MTGKIIDYALVIWCIMRDFLRSPTENRHIPFPALVTNLVEGAGIRGSGREKKVFPRPQSAHPLSAISGASSSSALSSMSTSPLKRMECRIKGWFKCILGKHKQLDHRLSRLESHILRGEPVVVDDLPPDLEGDSNELDDCIDEDAFSSPEQEEDIE